MQTFINHRSVSYKYTFKYVGNNKNVKQLKYILKCFSLQRYCKYLAHMFDVFSVYLQCKDTKKKCVTMSKHMTRILYINVFFSYHTI